MSFHPIGLAIPRSPFTLCLEASGNLPSVGADAQTDCWHA